VVVPGGGVGVDELTVDGEVERVGDHPVDLEHRLGGESLSASTAVGDEVGVAGVEVGGSECVESDVPIRGAMLWSIIHRYRLAVWRVRVHLVASQVVDMNPPM
jgi:hypothetical protein